MPTATPRPPLAYQLAVIQQNGYVASNAPLVQEYRHALDVLAPKCRESRQNLADFAVATHNFLAKHGIQETELSTLQHVADSIPADAPVMICRDVFAAYATLRIGG